jgi:hypothetical protein
MDSNDLAKYIENNNGISKPWLLMQLRLKKLEEDRNNLTSEEYMDKLEELHQDLMNLGEWWKGIEKSVFNPDNLS